MRRYLWYDELIRDDDIGALSEDAREVFYELAGKLQYDGGLDAATADTWAYGYVTNMQKDDTIEEL